MSDIDMDTPENSGQNLREFAEQQAREAREAREALAAMQAREVFRDAGLDPKNPLHAAVMDGYKGEISSEKVEAFVSGLGLQPQAQPPAAPAPPPTDTATERAAV